MPELNLNYDVLIVGAGVAGMYGALSLPSETRVLLLSKYELETSSSNLAQGGVAAVLSFEDDSFALHYRDTFIAGRSANCPKTVGILVEEGPADVRRVMTYGVDFDRNEDGDLDKTLEGGHSRRRIVHHRDCTGAELVKKLGAEVKRRANIDFRTGAAVLALEKVPNGYTALLSLDGGVFQTSASAVILATGGIGRVYRYTTNPRASTGDGIRFAERLGAEIKNLHYVQFHPTAFHAEDAEQFLISESVRGEGAYLLNCRGERFMHLYDERLELAPRDVVSRAILLEQARTGSSDFYLDITHEDADFLRARFPAINEGCLKHGVDMTKERIPVYPCQHYLMGGIAVDEYSRTGVPGLYACGECANTGVHGKNRLASNSLLEALVFSRRAAEDIAKTLSSPHDAPEPRCMKPLLSGPKPAPDLPDRIRAIMQSAYFVEPDPKKIREGLRQLLPIVDDLENGVYALCAQTVEARSLAAVARIILESAAKDYPIED